MNPAISQSFDDTAGFYQNNKCNIEFNAGDMSMTMIKRILIIHLAVLACLLAASCTVVRIDEDAAGNRRDVISAGERAVDAAEYLEEYMEPYILPEINERKVDLSAVLEAAKSGWDNAGEAYGEIKGDIGAKYNFIVHDTAVVKEINTESRNGFMIVEPVDAKVDYTIKISIGPVFRGTAIRDSIRFIDFNHFVNQMDFAELANELNRFGNNNVTQSVDVMALEGKTIEFTGSFTQPDDNEISIMPIFMEVK